MNTTTTPRQQIVLNAIRKHLEDHGVAPTLKQLMTTLQYSQQSSVQRHVEALRAKGLLPVGDGRHGIKMNTAATLMIPLAGTVECGTFTLAEEHIEAHVPYATSKLNHPDAKYFFVRAHGDSMNRSKLKINEDDYLLVRQVPTAQTGDIIIALLGDDATCKVLELTTDGLPKLTPYSDNPQHKPRVLFEDFSILGIVESVVRPHRSADG